MAHRNTNLKYYTTTDDAYGESVLVRSCKGHHKDINDAPRHYYELLSENTSEGWHCDKCELNSKCKKKNKSTKKFWAFYTKEKHELKPVTHAKALALLI